MLLFRTQSGPVVEHEGQHISVDEAWETLINRDDCLAVLQAAISEGKVADASAAGDVLPPIGPQQEVWAAGVTYFRSRTARMEESQDAGGSDFYDRVYHADRPELFMKATPHRVVGDGGAMRLRRDSTWIVPEPELTLVISSSGKIIGYTAGNDLSCRDIEGENPLYLPQAKTFDQCAAIGPGVLITDELFSADTAIRIEIKRGAEVMFADSTAIDQLKKSPATLVEYLYRECSFPFGCLLMTGTGVVPPNDFTLKVDDVVAITIDGIGTLTNVMA